MDRLTQDVRFAILFSLAVAAALLGVTAGGAAYLPARRATQIDPVQALRAD